MKRIMGIVLMGVALVGVGYAAKPARAKKKNGTDARVVQSASKVDVAVQEKPVMIPDEQPGVQGQDNDLADDDGVKIALKDDTKKACSVLLDLYSKGERTLNDVIAWFAQWLNGGQNPTDKELSAMEVQLKLTVAIMNNLSKDPSLGLKAVAKAFTETLEAVRHKEARCIELLKQSTDLAASVAAGLNQRINLLVQVNKDLNSMARQRIINVNEQQAWVALGTLLHKQS